MKILGIDPSLCKTGWGIVNYDGIDIIHIDHGVISPKTKLPLSKKLHLLSSKIKEIIELHNPNGVCIEETYCGINSRTIVKLGFASGAIMSVCGGFDIPLFQYPAKSIKKIVTTNGNSSKDEVWQSLTGLLQVSILNLDASDALAVAVCHVMNGNNSDLIDKQPV